MAHFQFAGAMPAYPVAIGDVIDVRRTRGFKTCGLPKTWEPAVVVDVSLDDPAVFRLAWLAREAGGGVWDDELVFVRLGTEVEIRRRGDREASDVAA